MKRAKRSGGLHKRSAEDWGSGLRARGGWPPSRSVGRRCGQEQARCGGWRKTRCGCRQVRSEASPSGEKLDGPKRIEAGVAMIGTCKLCLRDGVELQRSHLLSAAVYRILRDDGVAPNPHPVLITPEGRVQSTKQQWAHLLCRSCEALLSREGEDWVFRHCMKRDKSFPLAELLRRSRPSVGTPGEHTRLYESVLIPEINAAAKVSLA